MKKNLHTLRFGSLVCFTSVIFTACTPSSNSSEPAPTQNLVASYDASIANRWNDLELKLIRTTTGFTPPVTSRALGYIGVSLYESVVPGMPAYQSLANQLQQLKSLPQIDTNLGYNWGASANAAQATIVKNLFANTSDANKKTIDSLELAINDEFKTSAKFSQVEFDRGVKFGKDIATAVFEWSKTDGGHEGYLRNQPKDFVPETGPGKWIQTTAGDAGRALQPTWGKNRTFMPVSATMADPAPLQFSRSNTSLFYVQALEVYSASVNQTPEQKEIALFWADGGGTVTPPGHEWGITQIALKQSKASLDKASEAYAKVGIAVADAFICCWRCKYTYSLLRPESYINEMIDSQWKPTIATPPFPEHTSGHSTQSGATAQVLTALFGSNFLFTDNVNSYRGVKNRSFGSFEEAAQEAAISRLYGGIHYRNGNETGLAIGKKIGNNVNALQFKKIM